MNTYKSHFVRGAALIFAVILMASFVACKKIPTLTPDVSGGYVNDKTGVIYYDAPGSYSAKTYLSEEAVAINDGINF